MLLTACFQEEETISTDNVEKFSIAANKVACEGVAPMQCLVVNGKYFYDYIKGYEHIEGQSAEICVNVIKRPEPIPADVGIYEYHRVDCG